MQYQDLNTILTTTNRVPFDHKDITLLIEYVKMSHKKGYDIYLDSEFYENSKEDIEASCGEGFIILQSYDLDTRFLFVNVSGGVNSFGKQKRKIMSFIGDSSGFQFTPGHAYNTLIIGLTAINNVYRAEGDTLSVNSPNTKFTQFVIAGLSIVLFLISILVIDFFYNAYNERAYCEANGVSPEYCEKFIRMGGD